MFAIHDPVTPSASFDHADIRWKDQYENPYIRHFLLSGGPQQEQLCNKNHAKLLCDLCPEEGNI